MNEDTVKAIIDTIQRPVFVEYDAEHKVAVVPEGTTVIDLAKYLPPPPRVRQKVDMLNVPSFVAYTLRYAKENETTVFANEPTAHYEGVIDYHNAATSEGESRHEDHVVVYTCPQSDQWKLWVGMNGRFMNQLDFAKFLESNLRDVTDPPGADFLALALNLQIHKKADFESEIKLENGAVKFRYAEEINQTKKAGDIAIPALFKIAIPVFVDGSRYALEARFRYNVEGGKLACGYELIRHQDVYNAAVKQVTKDITEGLNGKESDQATIIPVYVGRRF